MPIESEDKEGLSNAIRVSSSRVSNVESEERCATYSNTLMRGVVMHCVLRSQYAVTVDSRAHSNVCTTQPVWH